MTEPDSGAGSRPLIYRIVAGFGRFWWDFLVGDTPELLVGSVVVVGLVALVCIDHSLRTIAAVVMPVLVSAVVVLSVWKESRRRRPS